VKTLTEDQRNPDVLYAGTETGLFVTLDRGKNWQRLNGNYPNVRTDEITLHPRDNAMLLATHGRAIWILDHISPIQEYAAAQAAASGAKLFSIDPALEWKAFDDKNDEFWGHQYFMGENPPSDAVIQYFLKNTAKDAKLTIADAAGKSIRELPLAGNRLESGIQTACWDFRVEPIAQAGAAPAGRGGPGGGGAGAGGGGRRGAAGGGPNSPLPQPEPGFGAMNPCAGGGAGFGGGGGRGGGGSPQGPLVPGGTYTVTLVVDGKTIESKPLKVVMDPAVQMNDAQQKRYFDIVMDLHDMQRRGSAAREAVTPLETQMTDAAPKVNDAKVPAAVKTQFADLNKELAALREKLGMVGAATPPAGGGRGGGPVQNDVISKIGSVKSGIMAFSEMPSATMLKQYDDVKTAFPKAISDTNAFLLHAMTVSQALKKYDITLTVPAPIKYALERPGLEPWDLRLGARRTHSWLQPLGLESPKPQGSSHLNVADPRPSHRDDDPRSRRRPRLIIDAGARHNRRLPRIRAVRGHDDRRPGRRRRTRCVDGGRRPGFASVLHARQQDRHRQLDDARRSRPRDCRQRRLRRAGDGASGP
jgi:hypothetical protein